MIFKKGEFSKLHGTLVFKAVWLIYAHELDRPTKLNISPSSVTK